MKVFEGSRGTFFKKPALVGVWGDLAKPTSGVPKALTVKAALTRDRARQDFGGNPAFPRGSREAPPEKPGRAIPLSWEIKDFPSHGEPQTVRLGAGPET